MKTSNLKAYDYINRSLNRFLYGNLCKCTGYTYANVLKTSFNLTKPIEFECVKGYEEYVKGEVANITGYKELVKGEVMNVKDDKEYVKGYKEQVKIEVVNIKGCK